MKNKNIESEIIEALYFRMRMKYLMSAKYIHYPKDLYTQYYRKKEITNNDRIQS